MWYTADVADSIGKAVAYGFGDDETAGTLVGKSDWKTLKHGTAPLFTHFHFRRRFGEHNTLTRLSEGNVRHDRVVFTITAGGRPTIPSDKEIPGASYGIDSDGFFEIEEQPKRVAAVGAGYIAVELAGVFNTLGTETHMIIRYDQVLRRFDPMLSDRGRLHGPKDRYTRQDTPHLCGKG